MTWRLLVTALLATLVSGATGYVWWGLPLQRLRDDVDVLFQDGTPTQALCAEFPPGAGGATGAAPQRAMR